MSIETEKQIVIRIPVAAYNQRRYGRPWVAVATAWPFTASTPDLDLYAGVFVGSDMGGELKVRVAPGSLIRWGQKDHRAKHHTEAPYGIVCHDGRVVRVNAVDANRWINGEVGTDPQALGAPCAPEDLSW